MGAVGADGKELITAAGQNQFFAVGLARYHAAIAEIANRKSISEIGFVRLWCVCHDLPPSGKLLFPMGLCTGRPSVIDKLSLNDRRVTGQGDIEISSVDLLFPRLRQMNLPDVAVAISRLELLQRDHLAAASLLQKSPLQRFQVFNQILLFMIRQMQRFEAVVVIDYVHQTRETPVVIKATFCVSP